MSIPDDPMTGGLELARPEAVFRIEGDTELCPRHGDEAMQQYLARRIAARPGDLRSHTRRVLLSHSLGDTEEAFAALVDLAIATGTKGGKLKQRLVRVCAPLFTSAQQQFLEQHCADGLPATASIDSSRTMLTSGANGGTILVGHS
jgi:hypothetical protein